MRLAWFTLIAVAVVTILFGTLYGAVQQSQRIGANDPQIQLAEDAATKLNLGTSPKDVVSASALGNTSVNINNSLAPFVIVYDRKGSVVAGNGYFHAKIPTVPMGILKAADSRNYHAVTWQPEAGLRFAAVSVSADRYYVLSGRSLQEVESREGETEEIAAIGWVASLIILLGGYLAMRLYQVKRRS